MPNAKLVIEIITEAKDAVAGASKAQGAMGKFQSGLAGMAAPAAVAGGAIIAMGTDFARAASDMEQSFGGLDAVFGKSADKVKAWAEDSATSVGLSKTEYADLATLMGAQFTNMGQSTDDAAESTKKMMALGADLAATFGGSTADAVSALSSALKGEADPAEKYGLSLSAAAVNAEMAAEGTDKLTGEAAKAAKAQAILSLATDQAGGAIGQFGREMDSASGQSQQAQAAWADARAELGVALLPVLTTVMSALAGVGHWLAENKTMVLALMGVIGGFAAAILVANGVLKVFQAAQIAIQVATKAWAIAQAALNVVLNANPIGIVILAVAALTAGIILLWKKSETFRDIVTGVWRAIATAATVAWNAIKSAVSAVINAITAVVRRAGSIITGIWTSIKGAGTAAFNAIKSVVSAVVSWIQGAWRSAMAAITGMFNGIKSTATTAWNAVKAPVSAVIEWIKAGVRTMVDAIGAIWNRLGAMAASAWAAVKAPIQAVVDWAKSIWDTVVSAVADAWARITSIISAAVAPIKSMIDGIKSAWDSTVGAISSTIETVKGWLSDLGGKIKSAASALNPFKSSAPAPPPASAVTYAGTARVAGLSAAALGGPTRTGAGMSGAGVTVNVSGVVGDPDSVARIVQGVLTGRRRRVGPLLLGGVLG